MGRKTKEKIKSEFQIRKSLSYYWLKLKSYFKR